MEDNNNDVSLNRPIVNNYYGSEPGDEQQDDEHSISFSQIWHMLKKHWVAIVVCTLVGLASGVLYGRLIKKPKYEATSQIMIKVTDDSGDISENISQAKNQAQIASKYISYLEVREAVCSSLAAKYPEYDVSKNENAAEDLSSQYSVSLPTVGSSSTTSIFVDITATTSEKQQSVDVANAIANVTKELSNGTGDISSYLKNSIVVAEATTATDSSTSNIVIALIGTLIGLVVGCGYAIIRELTNNKVTSKYELEQLTGVKIIGMIPKYEDDQEQEGASDNGKSE